LQRLADSCSLGRGRPASGGHKTDGLCLQPAGAGPDGDRDGYGIRHTLVAGAEGSQVAAVFRRMQK
jgi:hypothetical protein